MNNLDKGVSRRDFVGWVITGGILTTLAGMLLPALEYILPVTRRGPGGGAKDVGALEDIPIWGSKKVVLAGSALILIRTPKELKAFSAICTHLGCIVDWDEKKKEILCPCHAGIFDVEGRVVAGPPPRPLVPHAVNVVNGKIFVSL